MAAAIVSDTPPPELYRTRTEMVQVERTVRKPAALPFLPPKIEKEVFLEKRERREQILVDTTVLGFGWAARGDRLCILSSARPGREGRNIYGAFIPPDDDDGSFLLGSGVARNRNELVAGVTGVARWGKRWVEVVPVLDHRWEVEASPDGATYFLSFTPGDRRLLPPQAADVIARAVKLGAPPDGLIPAEEVAAIVSDAVGSGEAVFSRSLSRDRDAVIRIDVDGDAMRATLTLRRGRGRGRPLDLSELGAALKASGVKGLKADQLKKDVLEFYKSADAELVDYPLASGRSPIRGRDRVLALTVPFLPDDRAAELRAAVWGQLSMQQALPAAAGFPLDEANKMALVRAGQKIGELSAGSPGQDGVDVYGRVVPGMPGNDPVIRTFGDIDFSKGIVTSTTSGVLFAADSAEGWSFRAVKMRDASIDAWVDSDGMSAALSLKPEEGLGAPLTVQGALAALGSKGVVRGIDAAAVAEAVADARAGKAVLRRIVARGKPSRPAGFSEIEWLVGTAGAARLGASCGDSGERSTAIRVTAGQSLLRLSEGKSEGEDGVDVLGRRVAAASARPCASAIAHDLTIVERGDGPGRVLFVAAASGELVETAKGLTIRERLRVGGDVGSGTGNVKFDGVVHIAGSILSGFSVVAGGDVTVDGTVEAALLSSEGSIVVGEGIKGARKGTVRARAAIEAAFAEQAMLLAVDDIEIRNSCVLCSIKTNGKVVLSSERGVLMGGLCRARKGIDVAILGSENSAKTEVSFGQDYLVADQIEAEEREIEKLKALIIQTDKTMYEIEKAGAGLDRVRQDKTKLVKLLEKRGHRLFDLRERYEQHCASEIRVRGTIYPGVILESHNRFFEVRTRKVKVVFAFDLEV
ncbi:MAG: FapA family protein, partial [Spirochaetaceae bacterium]|nr:FapA family protein [Spirochaetaceae bacterium]